MYIITVEIHIDHICILEDFVPGSNTVNTQYKANHVLGRFCPQEDFIPDRIQSFDLSLYYTKHSSRSNNVFFRIFCRGGFCPNNNSTFSYVYHYSRDSQIKFCILEDFVRGGFCPDNNSTFFYRGLIQLTLSTKQIGKILSQGRFYPGQDSVLCFITPLQ